MKDPLLNVEGIYCASINAGIKNNDDLDLSVISLTKGSVTAAVFTQNIFCAAPVLVAKNHLQNFPRALLINSGNANAGTGKEGIVNTLRSCEVLANELDIKAEEVLPFSTGVIGKQIDLSNFESGIPRAVSQLAIDSIRDVAKGILTTDLIEKYYSKKIKFSGKEVTLSGIAKGSGMIRPDMATMLSFIFTDIGASQKELQDSLAIAVDQSFNRITVDGDTSTNDACTLSATNQSGVKLDECKDAIREIQRVSNGRAFIQVDAYRNELELKILKKWILTAKTYLKPNEWTKLFKECGYTGYYDFTILKTSKWLKL